MQENFEDVKVGDKVIIRHSNRSDVVGVVERITKTQFVVGFRKFWKKNGDLVGGRSMWSSTWCVKGDEMDFQKVEAELRVKSKQNEVYKLVKDGYKDLNEEQLDKILSAIKEINGESATQ